MDSTPKKTTSIHDRNARAHKAPLNEHVRLNHFLAQVGIASRRAADDMIAAGRVRVDGRIVKEMGIKIVPGVNAVEVDHVVIGRPPKRVVLLMHKPKGIVSTVTWAARCNSGRASATARVASRLPFHATSARDPTRGNGPYRGITRTGRPTDSANSWGSAERSADAEPRSRPWGRTVRSA